MLPHTINAHEPMPRAIQQMAENCKRDLPWFVPNAEHEGQLVIVGGGPSVKSRGDVIRQRQKNGATILALNGARKFLAEEGIQPDMVLLVDPSPTVEGFIGAEPDDAIYLIASICHPSVLDKLEGFEAVYLWHPEIPTEVERQTAILAEYPDKPSALIGGGMSGALRAMPVGFLLGYRTLHYYGIDSSYSSNGADHAYTKHDGPEPAAISAIFRGKSYKCSPWMVRQADEFKFYYQQYVALGCAINVHGDGLIPDIWRAMRQAERKGKRLVLPRPMTVH